MALFTKNQQDSFDSLCEKVEAITGKSRDIFLSKSRKREHVLIRQAIMVALRLEGWNLRDIGIMTGKRDHSSVIHMINDYHNTTVLMAKQGDDRCMGAVELSSYLRKFVGIGANQSRFVKIQIAKEMTAQGCGLYSIIGIVN